MAGVLNRERERERERELLSSIHFNPMIIQVERIVNDTGTFMYTSHDVACMYTL